MSDFFKCCFPSARKRHEDDEIELVPDAALPGTRRSRHNDHLKANISRPRPQRQPVMPPAQTRPSNPYPYLRRRPSEDLQDLVDDDDEDDDAPQDGKMNDIVFSKADRAHGHVLRDLNSALQHSRWAVSGSYAEALWACKRGKRRNIVSIICQRSSRDTTKVWLTSQSLFTVSPNDDNVLHYRGNLMGAEPVSVRIRWVSDRELERLQTVESTFSYREGPFEPVKQVRLVLLTLPALADNLAWSWARATEMRAREDFAADLFSVLERIVDLEFSLEGSGPLNAEGNVHIMSEEFWIPFTKSYPQAPALFAQCGAPIPTFGLIFSQPRVQQGMQIQPPALRLETFQKPRSAPAPPSAPRNSGRSLTKPSSSAKPSSSSNPSSSKTPLSSSRHKKYPSSSKAKRLSTTRPKPKTRHLSKDEIHPALRNQRFYRNLTIPVSPESSPQRPVHPANILHPDPEPRSKFSALFGPKESPETLARRRQEKLDHDRAARRASEKLAARIQRNREREREREWHTRKQAERMGLHQPPRKLGTGNTIAGGTFGEPRI